MENDITMQYLKEIAKTQKEQGKNLTDALVGIQELKTMTIQQETRLSNAEHDIDCLKEFKDNTAGGLKVLNVVYYGVAGICGAGVTLLFTFGDKILEFLGGKP